MSITIHIDSELEQRLYQLSAKQGLEVEHFIEQLLKNEVQNSPTEEEELVAKISQGASEEKWKRFHELKKLRIAEKLSPVEHQELIAVYDEIEAVHADRMFHLVQLSKIKNVPVLQLMDEFDLKPRQDV